MWKCGFISAFDLEITWEVHRLTGIFTNGCGFEEKYIAKII